MCDHVVCCALHAAIQGIIPAVHHIAEYAVRVSSRIVAQVQERVSTDWIWQVHAVSFYRWSCKSALVPEPAPGATTEPHLCCFPPMHTYCLDSREVYPGCPPQVSSPA